MSRAIAWVRATVSLALFLVVPKIVRLATWLWPPNGEYYRRGLARGLSK